MNLKQKEIENIYFEQIKNLTKNTISRLDSFDRQFSGKNYCAGVFV